MMNIMMIANYGTNEGTFCSYPELTTTPGYALLCRAAKPAKVQRQMPKASHAPNCGLFVQETHLMLRKCLKHEYTTECSVWRGRGTDMMTAC